MSSDDFVVRDSGRREEYENGFVRDTEEGKPDYARIMAVPGLHLIPIEMLERLGAHLLKGATKYGENNWRRAKGLVAKLRFARSLFRHARQLILGQRDEDHASATTFNVWAYELTPAGESVYQDEQGAWHDRLDSLTSRVKSSTKERRQTLENNEHKAEFIED